MAHCHFHALSSVRKWGDIPADYLPLHQWFDQSKAILADPRHRASRHHSEGIFILECVFGTMIVNADGRIVPVRMIGEQHVREDLGSIPSFSDWARLIAPQIWMLRGHRLDETFDGDDANAAPSGAVLGAGLRGGENRSVRIAI